jgi:hypothetical protein
MAPRTDRRRGRPALAGAARSRRVEFRVTPEEYRQIHALAVANQSTVGEWCRFGALSQARDVCDDDEMPAIVIGGRLQAFQIIRRT